jgi:UDP-N-acetyl-D-mannosaminuronic acid dehydrogenase
LTENSYRDVNIAFANELSIICDKLSINVWELIKLANRHPRVNILQPGPGVGGHCIAVDPWFIVSKTPKESPLIRTAREVNNYKAEWVIEKTKNTAMAFERDHNRMPVIACFGLAFKADIDDLRESPAMDVAMNLSRQLKTSIIAIEPNIKEQSELFNKEIRLVTTEEALIESDIILILVDHKEFKEINWNNLTQLLIDTKGMITP